MEIRKTTALASFVTSISLFWVGFVEFASAQASCQGTVDGVATEMRRKGTRVEVLVHPWGDSQEDSLENTKRVGHVAFVLHSGVLMTDYSRRIFANCWGTGYAKFSLQGSDFYKNFGMKDTGELGVEECSDSRQELTNLISSIINIVFLAVPIVPT
jgi:hypothetical protein